MTELYFYVDEDLRDVLMEENDDYVLYPVVFGNPDGDYEGDIVAEFVSIDDAEQYCVWRNTAIADSLEED